ncbi:MAG: sugar phosphate nucleotidyltransferase [Pseudomonadota bacterium]|jgi:mannose-1-phosphate guanylyltransferase/mannose-6-phosphate isomerase
MTTRPIITPVILSGGAGTRLWPLSHQGAPKQFHALATGESLLQDTMRRLGSSDKVTFRAPSFIGSVRHGDIIEQQCKTLGVEFGTIVLEPTARNTAAAAYIAAMICAARDPNELVLLAPADHVIRNSAAFHSAIARAADIARTHIVTFGIRPQGPETGFGYIKEGASVANGVFKVDQFAEKPNVETAERYLAEGNYVWNAGIFLFRAGLMLDEMVKHAPEIATQARLAFEGADGDGATIVLDEAAFSACPSSPVDIAVMEKTNFAAVTPCDIGWSDIGSWSELWRLGPQDDSGNRAAGPATLIDSQNSLVWSDGGTPVAAIGVDGLIIVSTPQGVLVAPMDRAQDVKAAVEAVKMLSPR